MRQTIPARTASVSRLCLAVIAALLLTACVSLPKDFRQPGVSVVAIKPRVLNSMTPEFDILLRVSNPNRRALEITGLSYELRLAGSKVIEGVASELPLIEAYGEAEVTLRAYADLLGSLGVLSRMMDEPGATMDYEFNADLDIGMLYPTIRISRSGSVGL